MKQQHDQKGKLVERWSQSSCWFYYLLLLWFEKTSSAPFYWDHSPVARSEFMGEKNNQQSPYSFLFLTDNRSVL